MSPLDLTAGDILTLACFLVGWGVLIGLFRGLGTFMRDHAKRDEEVQGALDNRLRAVETDTAAIRATLEKT